MPRPAATALLAGLLLGGLLGAVRPAAAQVADTLAVPSDTLAVPTDTLAVPTDTLAVPPPPAARPRDLRPVVRLAGPRLGTGLTGVPARQPAFGLLVGLRERPGAFHYDLGVPGAPDGLALGGLPPHRLSLTLDGRPANDPITGRAAFERLPEDVLAPLFADAGPLGAAAGIATATRAFAAPIALTEIRYRAGPEGHQTFGVTHAQTRRPAFVERIGGERARLTALAHLGMHRARAIHANSEIDGAQFMVRVGVELPRMALELSERYVSRTEGAWGGVAPGVANPYLATAPVVDAVAQREATQNDLALTLRAPLIGAPEPLVASAYWTYTELVHTAVPATSAALHRYGLWAEQPLAAGSHRLRLRLDAWASRAASGSAYPEGAGAYPPEFHVTLHDSLTVAGFEAVGSGGFHLAGDDPYPSLSLHVRRPFGPLAVDAGARVAGARLSPVERLGFGPMLEAGPVQAERLTVFSAGIEARVGALSVRVEGETVSQQSPRVLLLGTAEEPARFMSVDGAFRWAVAALGVGVRSEAHRGLYADAQVATRAFLNADDSAVHRLEAGALPSFWGSGRAGVRAPTLFDGNLALDVFVRGRAWTSFQGRGLHPATALFGLRPAGVAAVPAQGVLDAVLQAGLGRGSATLFVAYENAMAGLAYPGVYTVPVYPLAEPRLRVGLFWVLAN